jgi:hypothetical protein
MGRACEREIGRIRQIGDINMLKLLAICTKIAKDLKCSTPDLIVDELDRYVKAFYTPARSSITVSYDTLNSDLSELIAVLAHEMRHHWQYEVGELKILDKPKSTILWRGQTYCILNGCVFLRDTQEVIPYHNQPWEIDANNYAASYLTRLANKAA